jgi:hypothetical protein
MRSITMGAATWQAVSMLTAALVGGYVAARLSGLRRTADGVLHGAVSWGATTVLYAVLATTALGALTAGMFGLLASGGTERTSAPGAIAAADPQEAQRTLEGIGLTPEQARMALEKLTAPPAFSAPHERIEQPTETVGTATGWLTATVLLSLVLSLVGGAMGARGTRRINRRVEQHDDAAITGIPEPASHVVPKQA